MKRFFEIFILCFLTINVFSQGDTIRIKKESNHEIFSVVEKAPEFPGGVFEMMRFIQDSIRYPKSAQKAGIGGKCFLKFVVNEDGTLGNIQVLKGVVSCIECDEEAVRVVKLMPKWTPAKMNGKPVKSYFNLPVNFKIINNKK